MYRFTLKVEYDEKNHYYVKIPVNKIDKRFQKNLLSIKGLLKNNGIEEKYHRKIRNINNDYYALLITKAAINRLKITNINEMIEVEFYPIEKIDDLNPDYGKTENDFLLYNNGNTNQISLDDKQKEYYQMIFKRKSFHIFKNKYQLNKEELNEINEYIKHLNPLVNGIKTIFRIVGRKDTSCVRGEYCILIYSEKKEHYLENIGYMGEQLDLYFAAKNIGVCWYGMGKTKEKKFNNLDFVIMLTIEKVDETEFRNYEKLLNAKRKSVDEIWLSPDYTEIADVVRFAPSACNTQPWKVIKENNEFKLYKDSKKRGIMPLDLVSFYNQIDIGIFILFLELVIKENNKVFTFTFNNCLINNNDFLSEELVGNFTIK